MYVDRIREVFERSNYHSGSQMNQQNFYSFMSQLLVLFRRLRVNLMILMWPSNSGNKLQRDRDISISTVFAKL